MEDTTPEVENDNELDPLQALQAEVEEWKELAHRKAAETENIRRRSALEKQAMATYASEHLITKMLPVLDDLHAAVEASKSSSDAGALRDGIELIYAKAKKIFEEAGVKIVEANEGEPFNVDMHEALMHMPSEEVPEGHIVQVVQRGYSLHEKILRHAKVVTSAGLLPPSE